jgi:beta-glucosidase
MTAGILLTSSMLMPTAAMAADEAWTNQTLSADERAQLLVDVLTLDEKITLLTQTNGEGLPQYGVPAIRGKDSSNGVSVAGGSTALPVGLALASTFNPDLAEQYGAVSGRETREAGYNSAAAPSIDLARTPWNGRIWESAGEDPLLTGIIGAAQTNGIQSEDIPAEVKHYNVYNAESRRGHVDVQVGERALQEVYTRPWEHVVRDANAASVMCAFNKVNGEYGCSSKTLLTDILKNQLGFKGFVQTDYSAGHSFEDYNAGLDTSGRCSSSGSSTTRP